MADELDKFVLEYKVDLKDSVSVLERLKERMGSVAKETAGSSNEFKKFGKEAAGELGKIVPGVNEVTAAVGRLGGAFTVATAAATALGFAVKAVIQTREQYNQQRSEGMQLGISSIRMEEYQRKFANNSNGYVSRDAAAAGVKQFADMANSAYTDPSRVGREARIMRMLGVNVGDRGMTPTGLNTELTQLATGLQGKSASDVQGIAKATGLSQDWLLTLQKLGPSIGRITEMTSEEIQKRQDAEMSLRGLNDQLGKLHEQFNELANDIANPLLPKLTELVKLIDAVVKRIPSAASSAAGTTKNLVETATGVDVGSRKPNTKLLDVLTGGMFAKDKPKHFWESGLLGLLGGKSLTPFLAPEDAKQDQQKKQSQAKQEQDKRDATANKLDEANRNGIQTANQMALAINMFSGAVQTFSSAVNIQQAWAAWAGEIGKANGIPAAGAPGTSSGGSLRGGGNGHWESSPYAAMIRKSAASTGVDPQMIYSIMMTESSGVNGRTSSTGAAGLMQITRGNQKAYGINGNPMDPASNIDTGAKIFKYFLDKNKGDVSAALRGYSGNSDPNYVSKVSGYYGGGVGSGGGESKAKMNKIAVQNAVAAYLQVPLEQVQRGGVTRGDADFAVSQTTAGIQNGIYNIKRQLSVAGLPTTEYARLQNELRDQTRGLDMMRQYGAGVAAAEPAGGRERTQGVMQIIVNVNGAQDPKAVADEVNNRTSAAMSQLLNHYSNGVKG